MILYSFSFFKRPITNHWKIYDMKCYHNNWHVSHFTSQISLLHTNLLYKCSRFIRPINHTRITLHRNNTSNCKRTEKRTQLFVSFYLFNMECLGRKYINTDEFSNKKTSPLSLLSKYLKVIFKESMTYCSNTYISS